MAIPRKQTRTPQELQLLGGSCLFAAGRAVWNESTYKKTLYH